MYEVSIVEYLKSSETVEFETEREAVDYAEMKALELQGKDVQIMVFDGDVLVWPKYGSDSGKGDPRPCYVPR